MHSRYFFSLFALLLAVSIPSLAHAADNGEIFPASTWSISGTVTVEDQAVEPRAQRMWHVRFEAPASDPPLSLQPVSTVSTTGAEQRPTAIEYSDFYNTRKKIHVIASWATIPMFVGEAIAGQKLYDGDGSESAKSAHGAFTAGLAALFAVNTVTGVWNLWDSRHDPNGRTRRVVHSVLMLAADAGFVVAASMAPDDDDGSFTTDRSAHRNMAIASMSMATASYLYMLVTR
jgi:hypothetical protein